MSFEAQIVGGPRMRSPFSAILPEPEVRARATSHFTRETIDARLSMLADRIDGAATEERAYLLDLRRREFGS